MTTEDMDAPWSKKSEVSVFDEIDIDELLAQLTPEEIEALENETDPDVSHYCRHIIIICLWSLLRTYTLPIVGDLSYARAGRRCGGAPRKVFNKYTTYVSFEIPLQSPNVNMDVLPPSSSNLLLYHYWFHHIISLFRTH